MVSDDENPGHAGTGRTPNHFAGGGIDRAPELRADARRIAEALRREDARIVPVWRSRSLVVERGDAGFEPVFLNPETARTAAGPDTEWVFLGLDEGVPVFAADVDDGPDDSDPLAHLGAFHDLHRIGATLGRHEGSLLAYARALTTWSSRHRFCGKCGHATLPGEGGHVRVCSNEACGDQHFPRTDPAIIVLVADEDRCLLGRKDIWPAGVYSTLAGFVEPGESLSEAVRREVREESGIEVGEVRYRSSQPWPFPSSIMLGFHAIRTGGELRVDGVELEDARWFGRDEFERRSESGLRLPSKVSIARRLIEDWLAGD
ncbi:MAG: NAD(+) diphosphatase [Gemmatimonadota bacterium]|nr:NAD(+) diphosphatase [Gemmatimonadota bacterium]